MDSEALVTPSQLAVPGTGLVTLVRQDTPAYLISVNSPLSAIAIRVKLHKEYTICNIYIDHEFPLAVNHMKNLVSQLPRPYIFLGDLNSRSRVWGDATENKKEKVVEQFLISNNAVLLNNGYPSAFTLLGTAWHYVVYRCGPVLSYICLWVAMGSSWGNFWQWPLPSGGLWDNGGSGTSRSTMYHGTNKLAFVFSF